MRCAEERERERVTKCVCVCVCGHLRGSQKGINIDRKCTGADIVIGLYWHGAVLRLARTQNIHKTIQRRKECGQQIVTAWPRQFHTFIRTFAKEWKMIIKHLIINGIELRNAYNTYKCKIIIYKFEKMIACVGACTQSAIQSEGLHVELFLYFIFCQTVQRISI